MSNQDSISYLKHIKDEIDYINSVIDKNATKQDFIQNETLKRAVVRSLEIIGEATKKINAEIKDKWVEVEWKNMAGMRDRLIHNYFGINYNIVWDVLITKLPSLKMQIDKIIIEEEE